MKVSNAEGRALLAAHAEKKSSKKFKGNRLSTEDFVAMFPQHAHLLGDMNPLAPPKKKKKQPPLFVPTPREQYENAVFIPFNTPSSKNSKQWTGTKLINSELVRWYKKYTQPYWMENTAKFRQLIEGKLYPIRFQLHFIRDSKRDFDYNNASQIVQDLMVSYGWIPDDSMRFFAPELPSYEVADKYTCGCWITVL